MSGVGAAVGLILGGWLTGPALDLFGTDIDGWRLTFLINVPIGVAAALLAPRVLRRVRVATPASSTSPAPSPARSACSASSTASPAPASPLRLERPLDHRQPRRRRRPARRLRVRREPRRAPAAAVPDLPQPHPRGELRGDDADARPRCSRCSSSSASTSSTSMGYTPAPGRRRVPAVLASAWCVAAGIASNLDQPGRPALPRRHRHADGRRRRCSGSPGCRYDTTFPRPGRHRRPTSTDILPFIVLMSFGMGLTFVPLTLTAVHHVAGRGLRHRLGRPQHDAAGRRRARPGDPQHGRPARVRPTPAASIQAAAAAAAGAGGPQPRRPPSSRPLQQVIAQQVFTDGATTAFLVGAAMMLLRLAHRLDLPQRQARGAGHGRPAGRRALTVVRRRDGVISRRGWPLVACQAQPRELPRRRAPRARAPPGPSRAWRRPARRRA